MRCRPALRARRDRCCPSAHAARCRSMPARARLCRAAPRGRRLFLRDAAQLRRLPQPSRSTTTPRSSTRRTPSGCPSPGRSALAACDRRASWRVISYPIAYGLARVFGRWSSLVSLLFVIPLFVSENIRLYGWVLFFIKGGVLDGTIKALFGVGGPEILFTAGAILFGMVYVYLPFMLFPMTLGLSIVPRDLIDARRDLGATPAADLARGRAAARHARHPDRHAAHLRAGGRRHRRGQDPRRPVDHRHHPRHRDRLHLCAELAAGLGARGAADAGRRRADADRHLRRFDLDRILGRR